MDVSQQTNSPYAPSTKEEQNTQVLFAIIEQLVDFVIHSVLRVKRKQLKINVQPELIEAYSRSLSATWKRVEQLQLAGKRQRRRYLLFAAAPFAVSVYLIAFTQYGLLPMFLTCFIGAVYIAKPAVLFKQKVIKEVMPELLFHLPGYLYRQDGYIPVKELEPSKLLPTYDDVLTRQEDYFECQAAGLHFELVECELAKYKHEKGEQRESTEFKGLVCRIAFDSSAKHQIVFQYKWLFLLRWLQPKLMGIAKQAKMSKGMLGGRYNIYCASSGYVEEVFTESILEKIEFLIGSLDVAAPEFSVVENQIIILLHRPKNFLEAPNFGQIHDKQSFLEGVLKDAYLMEELRSVAELLAANISKLNNA